MTRVFWVRHGEKVANLSRTFSHRVFDGDLTDHGRGQAGFQIEQQLPNRIVRTGRLRLRRGELVVLS